MSQTLCGTLVSAVGFAVLAQFADATGHGVVYTETGFRYAFLVAAVVALTGSIVSRAIPRSRPDSTFREVHA